MEQLGVCADCENLLSLIEIRKGRCNTCGAFFDPWQIKFAGDLHEDIERKIIIRESD